MPVTTVAVTGGRYYANEALVDRVLTDIVEEYKPVRLVFGDANGADFLAWRWAHEHNIKYRRFSALWNKYGHAAGPIRNREMLDYGVDVLIAFPGDKGTNDCIKAAEERMIPVRRIKDD
jgi:hypothetical protein